MKVLVLWADASSPNLGVRALAEGAKALVHSIWPTATVDFQSFGVGAAPIPVRERTLVTEQFTRASPLRTWLSNYDLVVDMRWGDSFTDIYGMRRLTMMSAFARIVRACGIPLVMGPQTIGPFNSRLGQIVGKSSAGMANGVIARDEASAAYCSAIGLQRTVLATDVVFAIPSEKLQRSRDIAVNVSGLLWNENPHVDARQYREAIVRVCTQLIDEGRHLSLFAHVLDSHKTDNDVPAVRAAAEAIGRPVDIFVPTSLAEVREFAAGSDLVIGGRMHACLNALSVGTPAIAMAYSRKFEPLLKGIGWRHTVDLRFATDPAEELVQLCRSEKGLQNEIPQLRANADAYMRVAAKELERAAACRPN
ncbi:polysaccharide pyruvyl transferase family protein [Rhodococcus ruber]|uniref:polysaccharide pyruvyl transferase family protein n=1 Tax=Rhodococcus ruber TaxID=1830 RepID=UPI0009E31FBC|nr:polysaccharide pyruvyl transferase family protein [Rhodococcus ruber]MDO1480753.1 polysaccharide pyruvyl transferase family protein [Rhodococcus ruber]